MPTLIKKGFYQEDGRIEAGLYSRLNWTSPESVWKQTETTSKCWLQSGLLIRTKPHWSAFTHHFKRTVQTTILEFVFIKPNAAGVKAPYVSWLAWEPFGIPSEELPATQPRISGRGWMDGRTDVQMDLKRCCVLVKNYYFFFFSLL